MISVTDSVVVDANVLNLNFRDFILRNIGKLSWSIYLVYVPFHGTPCVSANSNFLYFFAKSGLARVQKKRKNE